MTIKCTVATTDLLIELNRIEFGRVTSKPSSMLQKFVTSLQEIWLVPKVADLLVCVTTVTYLCWLYNAVKPKFIKPLSVSLAEVVDCNLPV